MRLRRGLLRLSAFLAVCMSSYFNVAAAASPRQEAKSTGQGTLPNNKPDSRPTPAKAAPVAKTESVQFLGKKFNLKFHPPQEVIPLYEYYPQGDTPEFWFELVDFRIYPVHPDGNAPIDYAQRTADAFIKKYPYMKFALLENKKEGAAMLDFFYPTSTRKEVGKQYIEFNAFKFFRDPVTGKTISFHYAKNIEYTRAERKTADVLEDIKKTRAEVLPAMKSFPIYTQ